ncbi:uncharacterized protein LOC133801824 [Humulus lupulus]|uniref:uncharacterized protein LOC133801824 n=1 Tax=Humulus lupulus TaxID=3486 RepID=UPI002B411413|nr:uncharacterized protein LOC133801824 [Humulus lupulus]
MMSCDDSSSRSAASSSSATSTTSETDTSTTMAIGSPTPRNNNNNSNIQMVSKSVSERLLGKFFDASQYDFDYQESGLWSPPLRRKAFLDPPAGNVCSDDDHLFFKLKNHHSIKPNWSKRFFSLFAHVFWCTR